MRWYYEYHIEIYRVNARTQHECENTEKKEEKV